MSNGTLTACEQSFLREMLRRVRRRSMRPNVARLLSRPDFTALVATYGEGLPGEPGSAQDEVQCAPDCAWPFQPREVTAVVFDDVTRTGDERG